MTFLTLSLGPNLIALPMEADVHRNTPSALQPIVHMQTSQVTLEINQCSYAFIHTPY